MVMTMRFNDIPEEVRKEHYEKCKACPERKYFAKLVDMHFDWLDCWFDCENDFDHYKRSIDNEID